MSQVTEVLVPPSSPTGGEQEDAPPTVETVRTKDFKLPCFSTLHEFEVGDLSTPTRLGFKFDGQRRHPIRYGLAYLS
jgi:hypothetical protein